MKRSAYSEARDAKVADTTIAELEHQRCPAHGCPLQWSVTGTRGKGCSAHYFAPRSDWPRITEQLRHDEAQRALERSSSSPPPALTREQKRAILARLQRLGKDPGSARGWATFLHEQHQVGARLTRFQVDAYQATLRTEAFAAASSKPLPAGVRP